MRANKKNNKQIESFVKIRFQSGGTYDDILKDLTGMGYSPQEASVNLKKLQEGVKLDEYSKRLATISNAEVQGKKAPVVEKTVAELWKDVTNTDWNTAKEMGVTTGTKKSNLELLTKLKKQAELLKEEVEMFQQGGEAEPGQDVELQEVIAILVEQLLQGIDPQQLLEMLMQQGADEMQAQELIQQAITIVEQQQQQTQGEQIMQEGGEVNNQELMSEVVQGVQGALADSVPTEEIVQYLITNYGLDEPTSLSIIEQVAGGLQ